MSHSFARYAVLWACIFLVLGLRNAFALAGSSTIPNYSIRSWQIENGLPQNTVTVVLHSKSGYLWIGTLAGLVRFDGVSFTVFDNDTNPELKNGRITALYEDGDSVLWIGHETGDLTRLKDGAFESVLLPAAWHENVVSSILPDESGDIWIQSRQGQLARLRDGKVIPPVANAFTGNGLATMALDGDGKLWVWEGGQLGYLSHGEVVMFPSRDMASGEYVEGFCSAADGGLWVVRGGRLEKLIHGVWQPQSGSPTNLLNATGVTATRSGMVIIRTTDQGVWLVSPGQSARSINRVGGLNSDWIGCVCEDSEGDLWIGSAGGGLNMLRPARFEVVQPPNKWNGMPVLSVCLGQDGSLWAGSEGSGLYRFSDNQWTQYGADFGMADKYVWSVLEDKHGRMWVGTWGNGLFVQKEGHFESAPGFVPERLPVMALLGGRDGELWLGTRSGLGRYEAGHMDLYGSEQGIKSADVRAIVQSPDGTVWFGMMGGGLGRLKDGKIQLLRKKEGLSSDFVLSLHLDAAGALWIGTAGGGLSRLKEGHFTTIGIGEGLPNKFVSCIQEDGLGSFWLSSAGGIFQADERELNQCADGLLPKVQFMDYGIWDGLATTDCSGGFQPAGCRSPDGRLWFSTRRTVVTVMPASLKRNHLLPPVYIEEIRVDGRPLSHILSNASRLPAVNNINPISLRSATAPWRIPAGTKRLEFQFTALSFSIPEKVRFKYRLAGLDPGWVEGDASRKAIYNHLTPGSYKFQVSACNNDGVWNEAGSEVAVEVLPLFWQTWWFHWVSYLGGTAAVVAIFLLDARRRHRRKLEEFERQHAVERERSRIAQDMHDDLGAHLTRISLLSQTAGVGLNENSATAQYLQQIYVGTRDLTRGMDEVVWAVNPHHDTLESLLNYLTRFAFEFLRSANIRCRINVPVQFPEWKIRSEVRHNVFLAFKEALNNSVKHSGATEVKVSLTLRSKGFDLLIEDNGCGFKVATFPGSLISEDRFAPGNGLANINSRLESVGGGAQIESLRGQGTRVLLSIPSLDHQSRGQVVR